MTPPPNDRDSGPSSEIARIAKILDRFANALQHHDDETDFREREWLDERRRENTAALLHEERMVERMAAQQDKWIAALLAFAKEQTVVGVTVKEIREDTQEHNLAEMRAEAARQIAEAKAGRRTSAPPPEAGKFAWAFWSLSRLVANFGRLPVLKILLLILAMILWAILGHEFLRRHDSRPMPGLEHTSQTR